MRRWAGSKFTATVFWIVAVVLGGVILATGAAGQGVDANFPATQPAPATQPLATTQPGGGPGLRFAEGPAGAADVVRAAVKRSFARAQSPAAAEVDQAQIKPPLAIYILSAADVANGKGLESAKPGGFQYLIDFSGQTQAAVSVTVDAAGVAHIVRTDTGVSAVPYGAALDKLKTDERVIRHSFEARLVRSMGLLASGESRAIWLKSEDGGTDLVYPIAGPNPNMRAPGGFALNKLYTIDEFLAGVRPIAQQRQSLAPARGRGG